MTDLLIRGVPDDVVASLDARALRLDLSRTELLRREFARIASSTGAPVTAEALRDFAARFEDLTDPDVMRRAWE